jgi:hypothetical protein
MRTMHNLFAPLKAVLNFCAPSAMEFRTLDLQPIAFYIYVADRCQAQKNCSKHFSAIWTVHFCVFLIYM